MKTRYRLLLVLLALLLPGASLACTQLLSWQTKKPQDKGGIELLIAVKADKSQLDQTIQKTMAVIQNRCDRLKIYCKLQRLVDDRLMLRFSSSMESWRVKNILLAEGLELRAVVSEPSPNFLRRYDTKAEAEKAATDKETEVLPYIEREDGTGPNDRSFVVVKREMIITGNDVKEADAISITGRDDDYQISFQLKPEAGKRFGKWTGANINNYIAVVYNKEIKSVAYIKSQITLDGEISGRFTYQQADDIAKVLMSGNLPASLELLEEKTYKP